MLNGYVLVGYVLVGYVLNGYVWDMCGVRYVWDMCGVRYVWDMCGVRYANNLLKNPATKRLSGKNNIKQIGSFLRVEEVPDSPDFFGLTLRVVEVGWDSHNSLGAGIISTFPFPARMHLSLREIRA